MSKLFITFAFLLLASTAMGANDTVWVKAADGDYTSLHTALDTEDWTRSAGDSSFVFVDRTGTDSTAHYDFDNGGTSALGVIIIEAVGDALPATAGVWDATAYICAWNNSAYTDIELAADIVFRNMQLSHPNNGGSGYMFEWSAATSGSSTTFENCLFHDADDCLWNRYNEGMRLNLINCAFSDVYWPVRNNADGDCTTSVHNCTFVRTNTLLLTTGDGAVYVRNNLFVNLDDDPMDIGIDSTVEYNISDEANVNEWGGTGNIGSLSFVFTDSANHDFHVESSSDSLYYGADLSSDDRAPVTDDIDGTARTSGCGYDYLPAAESTDETVPEIHGPSGARVIHGPSGASAVHGP